jgi:hypothetical protein
MAEMRADLERLEAGITPQAVVDAVDRASGTRMDPTGRSVLPRDSAMRIGTGDAPESSKRSPVLLAVGALAVLGILGGGGYIAYASMQPPATTTPPPTTPPTTLVAGQGTGTEGTQGGTQGSGTQGAGTPEGAGAGGAGQEPAGAGQEAGAPGGSTVVQPAAAPIRLETTPPGADVLLNGALLGVTPMEVPRPTGGAFTTVTLRLRGYREETIGLLETSPAVMARELTRAGGGTGRRPDGTTMETTATAMETTMEVSMEATMMSGSSGGSDGLVDPWQ